MRTRNPTLAGLAPALVGLALAVGATGLAGCASGDGGSAGGPTVVATTSILGDVVTNIVGDDARVEVLMAPGVDPHEFQLSARQAAQLQDADAIVANGLGLEEGLSDAIASAAADGVPVYEVAPHLDPLPFAAEPGGGGGDDATDALDPHVFTDPRRMADGVGGIADALAEAVPTLDTPAVHDRADAYADDLRAADAESERALSAVAPDRRILVTNHEVLGYFADRYDFEIIGAVVPSGTTLAEPSSQELSDLADTIRDTGVPAIFTDATSPTELADSLADETGIDVQVVPLFTESLGEPGSGAETYLQMVEYNADAIATALSGGSP